MVVITRRFILIKIFIMDILVMKKALLLWTFFIVPSLAMEQTDVTEGIHTSPKQSPVSLDDSSLGKNDVKQEEETTDELTNTHEEDQEIPPSHFGRFNAAPDSDAPNPDDDDSPIVSCLCEKKYDEFASCFWNISGGWWNVLGFTASQVSTILQILATIDNAYPGTFSSGTQLDLLIAAFILTEASSALHALQAYSLQTAKSRAHMANRIQVISQKVAAMHNPHLKSMRASAPSPVPVDVDGIESTSCDGCIKGYNTWAGGFWRISGGWFNILGFFSGQTSSILQAISGFQGGKTSLMIVSTVINAVSSVAHIFEGFAYKTAAARTKKADSITDLV